MHHPVRVFVRERVNVEQTARHASEQAKGTSQHTPGVMTTRLSFRRYPRRRRRGKHGNTTFAGVKNAVQVM